MYFVKCHGLWDEDKVTDNTTHKDESDGEISETSGRRDSVGSLKSVNLAASAESIHVHFPEEKTTVRRKSSSSGSQISRRSSYSSSLNRSKRGKYFTVWSKLSHPDLIQGMFSLNCMFLSSLDLPID